MPCRLKLDRAETLRYMRMGGRAPTPELEERLSRVEREVLSAARPRSFWRLERVAFGEEEGEVRIGPLATKSRSLARTLRGCPHAFLFCATLGAEVDALLRRYSQTSAADALMAQAAATSAIEAYCDECESRLREEPAVAGESLRARFSPGYGDLPLAMQRPLLELLDSQRRAGVVLTDALLMIPSKSVSAIIGSGPAPTKCAPPNSPSVPSTAKSTSPNSPSGCAACAMPNCQYRIHALPDASNMEN